MRVHNPPKALSILAVIIVCLTVMGVIACDYHPASSEHEQEAPIGHHPDGHPEGVSCLTATLPQELVLVELTFVSWVERPRRLHDIQIVSHLFRPPRHLA